MRTTFAVIYKFKEPKSNFIENSLLSEYKYEAPHWLFHVMFMADMNEKRADYVTQIRQRYTNLRSIKVSTVHVLL